MRALRWLAIGGVLLGAARGEDFVERMQEALSWSAFDGNMRVRLSGMLDVEAYSTPQPPPGLIYTDQYALVNPRLAVFLDVQAGPHVYAFAQARLDRGFDPHDEKADVRLDEYAIRISPWEDGRLTVQFGKFATVVGNWVERHLSWDNPFITAPLPYENLTGVWDSAAPMNGEELQYWAHVEPDQLNGGVDDYSDKYLRNPVIWGPAYSSGVSVSGRVGKFDYAVEMKNTPLSSRPEAWDVTSVDFDYPSFNGRFGFRPSPMWNMGFSMGYGPYLLPEAKWSLPEGRDIGDYQQTVLAQDISFAWHHFQLWAEVYECRFEVPHVGSADTLAYYIEAKYKFTPQFYGALRWGQQFYNRIHEPEHGDAPWGDDVWRVEAALGYRFSANTQFKLQYSLQHPRSATEDMSHVFAGQLTVKF